MLFYVLVQESEDGRQIEKKTAIDLDQQNSILTINVIYQRQKFRSLFAGAFCLIK